MESENSKLIRVLGECAAACNYCSTACLSEPDVKKMVECIRLDIDCAQICEVTAALIGRHSDNASQIIKICADICSKCAQECKKHKNMEHCRICAELCERCANMCLINVNILI